MPGGIPVGTLAIGEAGAKNAGILAAQIHSANFLKNQTDGQVDNQQ
jgi:phosphoribosylcarboxyaminoimidazole (NCAIR) mutase